MTGLDAPRFQSLKNRDTTQRSFEEAEPLVVRAIGIEESNPGPNRPNLACYLDTLAELKKAQVSYVWA